MTDRRACYPMTGVHYHGFTDDHDPIWLDRSGLYASRAVIQSGSDFVCYAVESEASIMRYRLTRMGVTRVGSVAETWLKTSAGDLVQSSADGEEIGVLI